MRPSCDWRLAQWSKTEREWTSGRKWNAQNGAVMGACCYSGWCDECWPDGVNGENWEATTELQRTRAMLEGRRPWSWATLYGLEFVWRGYHASRRGSMAFSKVYRRDRSFGFEVFEWGSPGAPWATSERRDA